MLSKLSKGYKVGSPGAGVAVISFFLLWILVSCNGQAVKSFNGWELSAGITINAGLGARQVEGQPVFFLVLLAGLGVFALAFFAIQRGHLSKLDGFGLIGLGIFPLVILLWQLGGTQREAAQQGIIVEYQYGLWGVVLGYLAVIVGGVMNLQEPTQ